MATLNRIPQFNSPAFTQDVPAPGTNAEGIVWGVAPLWDEATGEFLYNSSGQLILGNEVQSLKQWIREALNTPRLEYEIYDVNFGCDISLIIGTNYSNGQKQKLIEAMIRDALNDNRITTVSSFSTNYSNDQIYTFFKITTPGGYEAQFRFYWPSNA